MSVFAAQYLYLIIVAGDFPYICPSWLKRLNSVQNACLAQDATYNKNNAKVNPGQNCIKLATN